MHELGMDYTKRNWAGRPQLDHTSQRP
jgi:hypothetical protein